MTNPIINLVDGSFIFIIAISVLLLIGVTLAMLYFCFRYSEKRNPQADQSITGNTTLEVIWTVIPLFLVLGMFFYGWEGFKVMRNIPENAMMVKVTGKMWAWSFEYENGKKSDTLLYLPYAKDVRFELHSSDVIHSFYVPAFRVKEDCVPGRTNKMWFNTSRMGEFDILCAEYCGMNHAYMLGKLRIVPEEEFNEWVNKKDTVQNTQQSQSPSVDTTKKVITDTVKLKSDTTFIRQK
ncbi:MAG: cytochrome c oxidase subunit II [Ignavibacteria bacterium]|nr:cytochrome c oxidase subunit II [Ignavibacteria bacterium]